MEAILESGAAASIEYAAARACGAGRQARQMRQLRRAARRPLLRRCAARSGMSIAVRSDISRMISSRDLANLDSRILRTAEALLFQPGELPACLPRRPHAPLCAGAPPLFLRLADLLPDPGRHQHRHHAAAGDRDAGEDRSTTRRAIPSSATPPTIHDDPDDRRLPKLIPISKDKAKDAGRHVQFFNAALFLRSGSASTILT